MVKEKIDRVLEEIGVIKDKIGSLDQGQQRNYDLIKKNGEKIQRNYDLTQRNGIKVEDIASGVKAIAEGHGVLLNRIEEVNDSVKVVDDKLEETRKVVGETNRILKRHIQQPAHAA